MRVSIAALAVAIVLSAFALAVVLNLLTEAAHAATCFSSGEVENGLNKICFYSCPSGTAAITVPVYSLCPLTING